MGTFVIVFREAFEACLVLGIVFAFLDKSGQRAAHGRAVWMGTAWAIALSVALGVLVFVTVGDLEGTGEQIYEGTAMLLAATVVTWMVFWMRRQARSVGGALRAQVGEAVATGGGTGLGVVAFIAVAREGIESSLFLFASARGDGLVATIAGGVLGLGLAMVLGLALYRGSITLDLKRFFRITGLLVIGFAAYLLSGGLREIGEASGADGIELGGIGVAVVFAATCTWLFLRGGGAGHRLRQTPATASARSTPRP